MWRHELLLHRPYMHARRPGRIEPSMDSTDRHRTGRQRTSIDIGPARGASPALYGAKVIGGHRNRKPFAFLPPAATIAERRQLSPKEPTGDSNGQNLKGLRIAVLATDGVEQIELTEPARALREAGAEVDIVSPKSGTIQGMNHDERGGMIQVDVELKDARSEEFDALLLPGGVANPDKLRTILEAVKFVGAFVAADKPIAAICHGPWTLINAGGVSGKNMTSCLSLQQDLVNAGAIWSDEPVVVDHQLVTSRKPDDIPIFNAAMIELFAMPGPRRMTA